MELGGLYDALLPQDGAEPDAPPAIAPPAIAATAASAEEPGTHTDPPSGTVSADPAPVGQPLEGSTGDSSASGQAPAMTTQRRLRTAAAKARSRPVVTPST
jgi:hypothetical protein